MELNTHARLLPNSALFVYMYVRKEALKRVPQVSVAMLARECQVSAPTARGVLNELVALGIVQELSGHVRSKVYVYKKYLDVLEEGTEPLR